MALDDQERLEALKMLTPVEFLRLSPGSALYGCPHGQVHARLAAMADRIDKEVEQGLTWTQAKKKAG